MVIGEYDVFMTNTGDIILSRITLTQSTVLR